MKLTKKEFKQITKKDPDRVIKINEFVIKHGFPFMISHHGGFDLDYIEVIKLWYIIGFSKNMEYDLERFGSRVEIERYKDEVVDPYKVELSEN